MANMTWFSSLQPTFSSSLVFWLEFGKKPLKSLRDTQQHQTSLLWDFYCAKKSHPKNWFQTTCNNFTLHWTITTFYKCIIYKSRKSHMKISGRFHVNGGSLVGTSSTWLREIFLCTRFHKNYRVSHSMSWSDAHTKVGLKLCGIILRRDSCEREGLEDVGSDVAERKNQWQTEKTGKTTPIFYKNSKPRRCSKLLAETLPGMVSLYSLLKIFPWIQARKIRRPFLWHPTVHKPTESYAESNVLFLGGIIPSLLFPFATMNPIIL